MNTGNIGNIVARDSEFWTLRTILEGAGVDTPQWKDALSRAMEVARDATVAGEAMRRAIGEHIGGKITRVDDWPEPAEAIEQDNAPLRAISIKG